MSLGRCKGYFLLLCLVLGGALVGKASYASLPSRHDLRHLKQEINKHKNKNEKLEREARIILEKERSYRQNSAKIASIIQSHQKQLFDLRSKLQSLSLKREKEDKEWKKRSQDIFIILATLQRLSQTGIQAFLIYPYHPLKSVESSVVLGSLPPVLRKKVIEIRKEIQTTITLQKQIKSTISKIEKEMNVITHKSKELDATLQRLNELEKKNNKRQKLQKAYIKKLMKKANNLNQLLTKIESHNQQNAKQNTPRDKIRESIEDVSSLPGFPSHGVQAPLAGKVVQRFGARLKFGEVSKGISIQSSPGSLVVAPYDGIVMFAGDFHHHGMIVIIKHKGGYYSVLTGMTRLRVESGDHVVEGQPIGNMGNEGDDVARLVKGIYVNPILHYRLLYRGRPINPLRKISRHSLNAIS